MAGALGSFEAGTKIGGQATGLSQGLDIAFQMWLQGLQERRQSKMREKELATAAVFETDPAAAYKVLGMEAPAAPAAPTGTRRTKETITRGGVQTTYEAPEELNMTKLIDIYTKRASEYDQNAIVRRFTAGQAGVKNYVDKPFPTFDEWSKPYQQYLPKTNGKAIKQEIEARPEVGKDQVLMKAEDGTLVPVHKSRIAEAKKRGLELVED